MPMQRSKCSSLLRHPLSKNKTILGGLALERKLLGPIRKYADIVIDTSGMKSNEFRTKLLEVMGMSSDKTSVILSSFGFKYGIPQDSDYVLDVRFLPNPNYIEDLHALSGKDYEVQKYLSGFENLDTFIEKAEHLLDFVSSVYSSTGKKQLHIAVGCTGGRHRSVAVSEMLAVHLKKRGNNVVLDHRDIDKGNLL
ncbi:MAG: RNase adapter RapZ [Synergistaceae bacterium]|nr:RNase adapter RapZ [Synergistaceae bacterium]